MTDESEFQGLERFDRVDATREEAMFFTFLDMVEAAPDVVARRQRGYALLGLGAGDRVADVGCGLGTAAREMALLVGAAGSATGVDLSVAMVSEALRRASAQDSRASFRQADATRLPFDDGSVDAYRAERLYQHIADPLPALAEARRCLGAGGRILLVDQDWDTLVIDSDDPAFGSEVCAVFSRSIVNGAIGRQYRGLLLDAGFARVSVEPDAFATADAARYGFMVDLLAKSARAAGLDDADVARWEAEQRGRIAGDRFFVSMTHFLARAEKG